ncbi:MAG: tRNA-dihydrouridine synthase [Lachnospiraceae bacterium]
MTLYFAPLEGVTDAVFRRIHHECFPGVSKYFIPFISPTQNLAFTSRDWAAIAPENNIGVPAVPQLLAKDAALFLWAAQALCDMGYPEVNLNLGCPSGTVTAKGKGSGLLADVPALERLLDGIFEKPPIPVSIKTRIGYARVEEWDRLLDVFARYPIHELIIHPRTRAEFYRGTPHADAFAKAYGTLGMPLCYNGDLFSEADCLELTAFSEHACADAGPRTDCQSRALLRRAIDQGHVDSLPRPPSLRLSGKISAARCAGSHA